MRPLGYLVAARVARSVSTSTFGVIFPLVVASLHLGGMSSGLILSAASAGAAVQLLLAGFLGDRVGRRPVLAGMAWLTGFAAASVALVHSFLPLALIAFVGALGRGGDVGSGGASGPFAPLEQPLVAEVAGSARQTEALGRLSFFGAIAGAAGSLTAGLPSALGIIGVTLGQGITITIMIAAAAQILAGIFVLPGREHARDRKAKPERLSPHARGIVGKLSLTNALNGLGTGFLGPFFTYWLVVRFHVTSWELAALYTIANIVTALLFLASAPLARRLGRVDAVVWTRLIAAVFTALVALSPTFLLASALNLVRMAFQKVGDPARQSLLLDFVDQGERSRVSSATNLPFQVTNAVGPSIGGYLLGTLQFAGLPVLLAAILQTGNALLFNHFFGRGAGMPHGGRDVRV